MAQAAEQWLALRTLYESALAPVELLAAASGRTVASIQRRAARQGWRAPSAIGDQRDLDERIRRLIEFYIGEMEAIGAESAVAGGTLDKSRIDAISAMVRTLEKIGEITRSDEGAKENQTKRDADMSDMLGRIDQRIIELAREYAGELVARMAEG